MLHYFARYCFFRATCLFVLFLPRARKRAGKRYRPWLFMLQAIRDAVRGICAFTSRGVRPRATCIRDRLPDISDR